MFTVRTRASDSRARTGTLHLAHGDVRTPAFVPLATKGAVKTLEPRDVAALGYELILGNTFHLLLAPGPELVAEFGGLHEFMRWDRADHHRLGRLSGVLDGPRWRCRRDQGPAARRRASRVPATGRPGRSFRSMRRASASAPTSTDASASFHRRRRWPSRPRSAPTSRSCSTSARRSTSRASTPSARWSALTAGSSAACAGTASTGRPGRWCTGSSREGSSRTCGSCPPGPSPRAAATVSRSADRSGRTRRRCTRSWPGRRPSSNGVAPDRPRHLLGIGDVDDLIAGVELGIDTFDCAMPTRIGRHGVALVPDPETRWRVDLAKGRWRESPEPILDGCPCPACSAGFSRAYLHYLIRAGELTGAAARDASQPVVHRPADGRPPGGDRRRAAARGGGGAPGRRGAGCPRLKAQGDRCPTVRGGAAVREPATVRERAPLCTTPEIALAAWAFGR